MNKYPEEVIEQAGPIKVVVCKENGRIYRLQNTKNYFLQKIKVDGGLIKSGIRCDYAVDAGKLTENISNCVNCESEKIYLIELKGSDKDHACYQIIKTYNYFINKFNTKIFNCRIVLSKDHAPKLLTPNQKRLIQLEKQNKLNLLIKSQIIEESI